MIDRPNENLPSAMMLLAAVIIFNVVFVIFMLQLKDAAP